MKNILCIVILFFTTVMASQNNGGVKGTVTDLGMNNEPMLFANIQVKGVDTDYQTNFHGNFEISNLVEGEHILIVSYAGYETQEIKVLVKDDEFTNVSSALSPIQISFENVEGMEATSSERE